MNLRDHSLIRNTWPPKWMPLLPDRDDKPVGEVGILEDVFMSELIENKVFLFMQHLTFRYMGVMLFDDQMFSRAIFTVLKSHIGRSIEEIGNFDLSFTL